MLLWLIDVEKTYMPKSIQVLKQHKHLEAKNKMNHGFGQKDYY